MLLAFTIAMMVGGVCSLNFTHHDNQKMEDYLNSIHNAFPSITHLYKIGRSFKEIELWVIAIGDRPREHVPLRPHVKLIGNMHGNEVVSREVLLHLIDHLVNNYSTDKLIQKHLNTTLIHIMPSMNPDGYSKSIIGDCNGIIGRTTTKYIDLNRDFPDVFVSNGTHFFNIHVPAEETRAVMNWLPQYNFVLSANLHGGTKVVNYPFDKYEQDTTNSGPAISPDDDMFRHLALNYSTSHEDMSTDQGTSCGDYFPLGITNGAEWYPITGGMQDYNYIVHGVFEVLVEMSCCKFPLASELEMEWRKNKPALLNYIGQVHRGVKGVIKDEDGEPVEGLKLSIMGREKVPFWTKKYGEYFRLLMPGLYTLQVYHQVSDKIQTSKVFFVYKDSVTVLNITFINSTLSQESTKPANTAVKWSNLPNFLFLICSCTLVLFIVL